MNDSSNQSNWNTDDDEWLMLLAGEALGDLDEYEQSRLTELQKTKHAQPVSRQSLQRVADAIGLASEVNRDDLPFAAKGIQMPLDPQLIEKIRRDAAGHIPATSLVTTADSPRNFLASSWLGWCVAASLALVCGGMWFTRTDAPDEVTASVIASETEAKDWMRRHPDAMQVSWSINDPALVSETAGAADLGGVVWDSASQSGYMVLKSLPVNELATQQYQLWIIDPQRDEEPIDGGVFNIVQAGESYVTIHAKLDVIDPVGFAVTVEKPGGVVVSDQSRLPLLAMVP